MTEEQENRISLCFNSYKNWGERSPLFFTLRVLSQTAEYKDLPFGDVFSVVERLEAEWHDEWSQRHCRDLKA